jgi:transposase InsO family protein
VCRWTSKKSKVAGTTCFHYTAIDDGTRDRILRLSPRNNQQTSHRFFTTIHTTLPFPIRTRPVDSGTDFPLVCARTVRQTGLRLRDITPRCPEQNGKVERRHRVNEEECWSRTTFERVAPAAVLAWERRDNHERFSMALNGLTPAEQLATFTAAPSPLTSLTVPPRVPFPPDLDHGPTADRVS